MNIGIHDVLGNCIKVGIWAKHFVNCSIVKLSDPFFYKLIPYLFRTQVPNSDIITSLYRFFSVNDVWKAFCLCEAFSNEYQLSFLFLIFVENLKLYIWTFAFCLCEAFSNEYQLSFLFLIFVENLKLYIWTFAAIYELTWFIIWNIFMFYWHAK